MNKKLLLLLSLALLAAAGLLGACGSSSDDSVTAGSDDETPVDDAADNGDIPLGAGPYPIATLEISITHPEADPISYTISCLGDTATVTPAKAGVTDQAACLALNDEVVRTRLIDGPPTDLACTEIYGGPDEATITGTIDDQPVDATVARNNGCGIDDWDVVLAAILPPALGLN